MLFLSIIVKDAKILILGVTFKEDCPDTRNTKVLDVFSSLSEYTQYIDIFDPWVDVEQFYKEHGIRVYNESNDLDNKYDAIILAVSHKQFQLLNFDVLRKENSVLYDVKGVVERSKIDARL